MLILFKKTVNWMEQRVLMSYIISYLDPKIHNREEEPLFSEYSYGDGEKNGRILKAQVSKEGFLFYKSIENILCITAFLRNGKTDVNKAAAVPKVRFHDLRHTHAMLLQDKGVNIKIISERLEHNNIKITLNAYSRVLRTMPEDAFNKIE